MNIDDIMDGTALEVRDMAAREFRATVLKVARDIVVETPVDEGTARASWNISTGRADMSENAADKNRTIGPEDVPENPTLKPYFISSPLPYIQRLEYGHSEQAVGFIRAALARHGLL